MNTHSVEQHQDTSRQEVYDRLTWVIGNRTSKLPEKVRGLLDGGFDEFNHWFSVVASRGHSLQKE